MTPRPVALPLDAPLTEAARLMRDEGVGDVLVTQDGMLCGLLTDRDIVVRAVAEGRDLTGTRLADVCSAGIVTVGPDEAAEDALRLMHDRAVRRLPVVEDGRPVGVVSVGDLTPGRDEASGRDGASDRDEASGRDQTSDRNEASDRNESPHREETSQLDEDTGRDDHAGRTARSTPSRPSTLAL